MSTANIAKGKSNGRSTVATPDIVQNVNQVFEDNPHISVRRLSQQIGILRLVVNMIF